MALRPSRRVLAALVLALLGPRAAGADRDPFAEERVAFRAPSGLVVRAMESARAWDRGGNAWSLEALFEFENQGAQPVEINPGALRMLDRGRALWVSAAPGQEPLPARLLPRAIVTYRVTASAPPGGASGRFSRISFDFTPPDPAARAGALPVTEVRTEGFAASFREMSPAVRVARPATGAPEARFAWQVRVRINLRNPTQTTLRLLEGAVSARREDGTASYWGDGSGLAVDSPWFTPGAQRDGSLVLEFPDAPAAPQRITLRVGAGPAQELAVPPAR